jgi:hypothetical protein
MTDRTSRGNCASHASNNRRPKPWPLRERSTAKPVQEKGIPGVRVSVLHAADLRPIMPNAELDKADDAFVRLRDEESTWLGANLIGHRGC